jgi:hypothetical protein
LGNINKDIIIYIFIFASFLPGRIPFAGKYFRLINTLIHESGHALFSLLTNGSVEHIELFSDTSGVTLTKNKSKLSAFVVSLSGYLFASGCALLFFSLIKYDHYAIILYILLSLITVNLILFVRNTYGIIWLLSLGAVIVSLMYIKAELPVIIFIYLVSSLSLSESIVSAFVLVKISLKSPKKAGDAANLAKATHVPALLWSLIFLGFALFCFYLIIFKLFPVTELINRYV